MRSTLLTLLFATQAAFGALTPPDKAELGAPRNYLINGGFERGAAGVIKFADAAATSPVDGTGGSPSHITFSSSATSPLRDARSLLMTNAGSTSAQGEGISLAFTIDSASKAKILQIDFDYLVNSGTFVAGSSSVDSDVEVWVYDVTNSTLIQPSTIKLYSNSSTIADHFRANFQSSATGTSYRLILFVPTTATSAWALKIDNMVVSPSSYTFGTPITDWTNTGTVTVTATGSAPTKASATAEDAVWLRRVGSDAEVRMVYRQTANTAGVDGTGTYLWLLPKTVDTTKVTCTANASFVTVTSSTTSLGMGTYSNGTNRGILNTYCYDSTHIAVYDHQNGQVMGPGSSFGFSTNSTQGFSFIIKYPVPGWSSSVQMSQDTSQTLCVARVHTSSGRTIANNTHVGMNMDTTDYDTCAMVSTVSTITRATVATPGYYDVFAAIGSAAASQTADGYFGVEIYKNGSIYSYCKHFGVNAGTDTMGGACSDTLKLVAGDYVEVYAFQNSNSSRTSTSDNSTFWTIKRVNSPQAIGATETVAARYTTTAGQSITNAGTDTVVVWGTKDYDTHNGMNTSTGVYTVPAPGKYRLCAKVGFASSAWNASERLILYLRKNTTQSEVALRNLDASLTVVAFAQGCDSYNAIAGDTFDVQVNINRNGASGTTLMNTNAVYNFFTVERIGL